MKKLIIAAMAVVWPVTAGAADAPQRTGSRANTTGAGSVWGGLYIGASAGTNFNGFNVRDSNAYTWRPDAETGNAEATAGAAALAIGYNWQLQHAVLGLEAAGGVLSGYKRIYGTQQTEWWGAKPQYWAALRARAGLMIGNVLLFAAAGPAVINVRHEFVDYAADGILDCTEVQNSCFRKNHLSAAFGGGLEARFSDNWSVRGEYIFINSAARYNDYRPYVRTSTDTSSHILQAGLSYRPGR